MLWLKTAPRPDDARALPQFYEWLARFAGIRERPRFQTFYPHPIGKGKVKAAIHAEAVMRLFDIVGDETTIVACGAPAVKALLGPVNLAYVHGIPHTVEFAGATLTVFPMFDPAAGLGKGLLATIAHDLGRLGAFLRGELPVWAPDPRPAVSKWLERPLGGKNSHRDATILGVDTEGWPDAPWGVQFSWDGETAYVIRAGQTALLSWFAGWVENKTVVMHNGIHDLAVLRAMGIDIGAFEDTQLMAYHYMLQTGSGALESEAQNLGALGYRHAGMALGELKDIEGVDFDAHEIPYNDETLEYAGSDAIATRRLYDVFWSWLSEDPDRLRVYHIDQGQAFLIRHMQDAGMPFDYDDVTDYYLEILGKESEARTKIEAMAARRGIADFNPRSPAQVADLITAKYGLKVRKRTKSGKACTNEKALAIHRDHPFVAALQEYREITKLEGTYLTPLMENLS